jgi:hypothetical protein
MFLSPSIIPSRLLIWCETFRVFQSSLALLEADRNAPSFAPMGPELAVADGALGFWQAVEEVWPRTRGQHCWVHKTANVLNKLPKGQQSKAKLGGLLVGEPQRAVVDSLFSGRASHAASFLCRKP